MTDRRLRLQVLTPDRTLFDGPVLHVVLPGADGLFGVFPRHTKMMAPLEAGVVRAKEPENGLYRLAIGEGFAEVRPWSVRLLVLVGEPEEEVDRGRADRAAARARDLLRKPLGVDVARAEAALFRAVARLSASSPLHCRCCTICTCTTTCHCPPETKIAPKKRRGQGVHYKDDYTSL